MGHGASTTPGVCVGGMDTVPDITSGDVESLTHGASSVRDPSVEGVHLVELDLL
jgi:hypothetical protein